MTTTVLGKLDPVPVRPLAPELKVTQARVIKSEWIKFRSLRSTLITLGAAAVLLVGLGVLLSAFRSGQLAAPDGGGRPAGGQDPTAISLGGAMLAQLIIGSLGVLITATEYSTGMIRSSLAAVPRRLPVLWGKVIVFAVVTFAVMAVASFLAFFGGQAVLSSGGAATASLGDPGVLRAVLGSAVDLTGVGLLGLALGALLRTTAGAISTLFGVTLLLPGLIQLLPDSVGTAVGPYLPSTAVQAFMTAQAAPGANLLSPWAGLAVFAGYIVVLLGAAAVFLKRRDA
ncbi:ABC transporter permease subunit [Amycolatopsis sp. H20-H5]|uniref:ABC transporter permease subunit n=1 Tax=Amycolatopsis sp. H20-H5 TaxID=3046309 RepID=UPI002DBB31B5|nr:ABC transporter permease subunit [Amycolatopsis sp. H20-H5]MEC3979676.1 ABC transporter permease subunit [Amycolatopsis sp. H20-H5]